MYDGTLGHPSNVRLLVSLWQKTEIACLFDSYSDYLRGSHRERGRLDTSFTPKSKAAQYLFVRELPVEIRSFLDHVVLVLKKHALLYFGAGTLTGSIGQQRRSGGLVTSGQKLALYLRFTAD